jgi:hypothetical protein
MGSKKDIARVAGDARKQRAVGTQTRGELKENMTVAETPGSNKRLGLRQRNALPCNRHALKGTADHISAILASKVKGTDVYNSRGEKFGH